MLVILGSKILTTTKECHNNKYDDSYFAIIVCECTVSRDRPYLWTRTVFVVNVTDNYLQSTHITPALLSWRNDNFNSKFEMPKHLYLPPRGSFSSKDYVTEITLSDTESPADDNFVFRQFQLTIVSSANTFVSCESIQENLSSITFTWWYLFLSLAISIFLKFDFWTRPLLKVAFTATSRVASQCGWISHTHWEYCESCTPLKHHCTETFRHQITSLLKPCQLDIPALLCCFTEHNVVGVDRQSLSQIPWFSFGKTKEARDWGWNFDHCSYHCAGAVQGIGNFKF